MSGVPANPTLPNAGLRPVGDIWSSFSARLIVSTIKGRIRWSAYVGTKSTGDCIGVLIPWTAPYGECRACTLSKSSGTALIFIIRSRSSTVNRFIFARLFSVSFPVNSDCTQIFKAYRFWNQTWTCLGLKPGISRESRSRCAASGCACFANSLIKKRVC